LKETPFYISFKGLAGFTSNNGVCVLAVLHDAAVQFCNHMRKKKENVCIAELWDLYWVQKLRCRLFCWLGTQRGNPVSYISDAL